MHKAMLLYALGLAAILLVVPASAGAQTTWTDWNGEEHVHLKGGESAEQTFEGFIDFNAGGSNWFGCDVTIKIKAEGSSGGRVTQFKLTTNSCEGNGAFEGCETIADAVSIGTTGWGIAVGAENLVVTDAGGDITYISVLEEEGCATEHLIGMHTAFGSLTLVPTLNGEGTIESLAISGTATGSGVKATGTLTPESEPTLGLEVPLLPAWTDEHVALEPEEAASQSFEGSLFFTFPTIHVLGLNHRKYTCEATIKLTAVGPAGGELVSFAWTTETCEGEGLYEGCILEHHTTNVGEGWGVQVTAEGALVVEPTSKGKDLTFKHEFEGCELFPLNLAFKSMTLTPVLDEAGTIEALQVNAWDTTGILNTVGTLYPEGEPTLGISP